MHKYTIVKKFLPNSTSPSIYLKDEKKNFVSILHDIPLFPTEEKSIYNMIVEIPRWTNAKMEVSLKVSLNPIKHVTKNDKPEYIENYFPYHGFICNYGALPQTWENPEFIEPTLDRKGDNEQTDVIEIGHRIPKCGEIIQIKIIGCLGMIDSEKVDWKVIAINIEDPLAEYMNSAQDIDKFFPGLIKAVLEWYHVYNTRNENNEIQFAYNGDVKNSEFAVNNIKKAHSFWLASLNKKIPNDSCTLLNTTFKRSPNFITPSQANDIYNRVPSGLPNKKVSDKIHKWQYFY